MLTVSFLQQHNDYPVQFWLGLELPNCLDAYAIIMSGLIMRSREYICRARRLKKPMICHSLFTGIERKARQFARVEASRNSWRGLSNVLACTSSHGELLVSTGFVIGTISVHSLFILILRLLVRRANG